MTTKHTPGPWTAIEKVSGWAIISPDKSVIAKELNSGRDMGEADSKLIAQAPTLLQLLDTVNYTILQEIHIDIGSSLHRDITEAIKKATE